MANIMPRQKLGVFSFGDFTFTLGDMSLDTTIQVRARALTGFIELISTLDGDADDLLTRVGIDPALLEESERTLPLAQLMELLNLAGKRLAIDDIGLRLAQIQDVNVLGTVAIIAQHSATVGEALAGIARHFPYHTPGLALDVARDGLGQRCAVRVSIALGSDDVQRQGIELTFGLIYGFLLMLTHADPETWGIHFRHKRGASAETYARYFDCPVALGQLHNALLIPIGLLEHPVDQVRPELRLAAERFLANTVRRFPLDIGRQVAALIDRQLAIRGGSIERIANQLGLHRRTLQRRLAEQGLVFESILDDVRRQRSEEYLQYAAIPLAQIANLVGYNNQSSLNRSCVRWFGQTPERYRKQMSNVKVRQNVQDSRH